MKLLHLICHTGPMLVLAISSVAKIYAEEPIFMGLAGKEPTVFPQWADRRDIVSLVAAAKNNDQAARNTLGWRFAYGVGVGIDRSRARSLWAPGVQAGDARATYLQAKLQLATAWYPADFQQIGTLLKRVADADFGPAAALLPQLPSNLPGSVLSNAEKTRYVRIAANAGMLSAMDYFYNMSKMGFDPDIPKDLQKANEWWQKIIIKLSSAPSDMEIEELSHAAAMLVNPGLPIPPELRNEDRVLLFLRAGVNLGDTNAMVIMYRMYRDKSGLPPPMMSDLNGNPMSLPAPPMNLRSQGGIPINPSAPPVNFLPTIPAGEATDRLWQAAFQGNTDAMFFAADILFRERNTVAYPAWLRAAADRNHPQAMMSMRFGNHHFSP